MTDEELVDSLVSVLVSAILGCRNPNRAALDAWTQIVVALETAGVEVSEDVS